MYGYTAYTVYFLAIQVTKTTPATMKFERFLLLPIALAAFMTQSVQPTLAAGIAEYSELPRTMQYLDMMIFTLPRDESEFKTHVLNDSVPTMVIMQRNREHKKLLLKNDDMPDAEWTENFLAFRDAMKRLVKDDAFKLKNYGDMPLKLASVYCKEPEGTGGGLSTNSLICDTLIEKDEMPFYGFAKDGELQFFHGFSNTENNVYHIDDHVRANFAKLCPDAETCDHALTKKYMNELAPQSVDDLETILAMINISRDAFAEEYSSAEDYVVDFDERIIEAENISKSKLRWTWKKLQMLYKYAREQGDKWASGPTDEYDTGVEIHSFLEVPSKVGSSHPVRAEEELRR